MNELVLVAGLMSYAAMAVTVRRHFTAMTWPRAAKATRIVSDLGVIAFVWLMWRAHHPVPSLAISLLLFATCLALLFWTAKATRSLRLRVAFDPASPGRVMRAGPTASSGIRSTPPMCCSGWPARSRPCIQSASDSSLSWPRSTSRRRAVRSARSQARPSRRTIRTIAEPQACSGHASWQLPAGSEWATSSSVSRLKIRRGGKPAISFEPISLEIGIRQPDAIGLCRACGYRDCGAFGDGRPDPLSAFITKRL